MDAVSFADVLRNPDDKGPQYIYSEYDLRGNDGHYMLRDRQFKYIHNEQGCDELYDLINDPAEYRNLVGDNAHQIVVQRMHAELLKRFDPADNKYR